MNKAALAILVVMAGACGGGGAMPDASIARACQDMGGSACFQLPTAPLQNRDGAPSALGCGPIVPAPNAAALTISGTTVAFGTSKPIPSATLKLFSSADFATPFATTTSQLDGTYSIDIPASTPDVMYGEFSAADYLTLYTHAVRVDISNGDITEYKLRLLTADNVESAGLLVKEIWDPAAMVIAGNVLDCNQMIVMHAAVVLSTTSGIRSFVTGAPVNYGAPGAVPLAVPADERSDTNDNGAFAVFHVPPDQPLFVQVWGFVDAAAQAAGETGLTLIAEQPVHSVSNTVSQLFVWTR
jgi:hypothetical protein